MEIRLKFTLSYLFVLFYFSVLAQQTITKDIAINWEKKLIYPSPLSKHKLEAITFNAAKINPDHPQLALYSSLIPLPSYGSIQLRLDNKVFEPVEIKLDEINRQKLTEQVQVYTQIVEEQKRYFAGVNIFPYRINGGQLEIMISAKITLDYMALPSPPNSSAMRAGPSVLSDGEIYKLSISKRGIYKLDYEFLNSLPELNITQLDPLNLTLWGHPGGPLPEANAEERVEDLEEIPMRAFGLDDGEFEPGDYLLFYAEAADDWEYNATSGEYVFIKNIYDLNNYVFLKIGQNSSKSFSVRESIGSAAYQTQTFDEYLRYENDWVNLLGNYGSASGSGKRWFGEEFTNLREQLFTTEFSFQGIDLSSPVRYQMEFAGRSDFSSSVEFYLDQEVYQQSIGSVKTGDVEARYARIASFKGEQLLSSSMPQVKINYNAGTAEGWLDFIQFSYRKNLSLESESMIFRDLNSLSFPTAGFTVSNANTQTEIWDIANPLSPVIQMGQLINGQFQFNFESLGFKEFVALDVQGDFSGPEFVEKIDNQNLHGLSGVDMLILYPPEFEEAALRMADHRRSFNNFTVEAIPTHQVFNEFSSGKKDPSAIRDFVRLLYNNSSQFNYLLLLGDGSYDVRNITPGLANHNFILAYETENSLEPLKAFPTDDYFALLGMNEGDDLRGALDIAVGRLPVSTAAQASSVVDKIIHYETSPETLGDWRQRIAFSADDEDSNIHINDADGIAKRVSAKHKEYNQEKIYFDAFSQESTPGGDRYPDAEKKINDEMFKGLLVFNYLGHGGPKGWSQERVLKINDINSWDNFDAMALLVTATCSFTGFDDPALQSAGEAAILNPNGGVIALYSTVRAVYASQNERLTRAVFDTIFTKPENQILPIGEVLRRSKNANSADTININARKFLLIGDPAMRLNIPKYNIHTSHINGLEADAEDPDTIRALQKVSIEGFVSDDQGTILENFNGTVFPTVFDKPTEIQTLQNDESSQAKSFEVQRNVLFKGAASVINGKFNFSFVVPTDINYNFGRGKISYYASDGQSLDAGGYFDGIIIGGTHSDALEDNDGPSIELFMNTEEFVSGGITDRDPVLLAYISDENGINVSGTSIGHDLTATMDENTQNTFILNEFYTAELDDFTSGRVKFPFQDLELGKHNLRVKAFDVANNPGEGYIEFFVTDGEDGALEHVLNFPNPFTTQTSFMFEHDLANSSLDILIHIYTVSGKLVKTIDAVKYSAGFRVNDISWDGRDDFGSQLAKGIYLYKIKVRSDELNLTRESEFEKLVILQ